MTNQDPVNVWADLRCRDLHPRRYRPGLPCHPCEKAGEAVREATQAAVRAARASIAVEIERMCMESEQASGGADYATVQVERLRNFIGSTLLS